MDRSVLCAPERSEQRLVAQKIDGVSLTQAHLCLLVLQAALVFPQFPRHPQKTNGEAITVFY